MAAHLLLHGCGITVTALATAYAVLAAFLTLRWRLGSRRRARAEVRARTASETAPSTHPGTALSGRAERPPQRLAEKPLPVLPVTILKPLCGAELGLYAALRSFCDQAASGFQIVFGVRDPDDPALDIVRRLQRELPGRDLEVSVDATLHGSSLKVSNLVNMMRLARHDLLVIADSDVEVTPDYLSGVVAPLADPRVGIVTCRYRGRPRDGAWSILLAAFINDWFMPSVLVAAALGSRAFAFGATIALRREVLERIGGFRAIADQLADDYRLGELTRRAGLDTVLSEVVVDTLAEEASARDLVRHELRWLRTIRAVRPGSYAVSFVTFSLPVAALGCLASGGTAPAAVMLAATGAARVLLHFAVRRPEGALVQLWVLPLNDLLAFTLWCWGFVSRRVHWRQSRYRVARDGSAQPLV
jgi:ceramide glucosyltransferase